jgi:hypothetical protein
MHIKAPSSADKHTTVQEQRHSALQDALLQKGRNSLVSRRSGTVVGFVQEGVGVRASAMHADGHNPIDQGRGEWPPDMKDLDSDLLEFGTGLDPGISACVTPSSPQHRPPWHQAVLQHPRR